MPPMSMTFSGDRGEEVHRGWHRSSGRNSGRMTPSSSSRTSPHPCDPRLSATTPECEGGPYESSTGWVIGVMWSSEGSCPQEATSEGTAGRCRDGLPGASFLQARIEPAIALERVAFRYGIIVV